MRFVEDAPDIPDDLIEARDNGSVVFLCGAGVSMPVGLPSFQKLTEKVIKKLGVDQEEYNSSHHVQFDQIFNQLCRKFGRSTVIDSVHRSLRTPAKADTSNHV